MSDAGRKYGPPHVLVVLYNDTGAIDYEIEHPGCPLVDKGGYEDYDCGVAWELDNAGTTDLLDGLTPGQHIFRHWSEAIRYRDGVEHETGFEIEARK